MLNELCTNATKYGALSVAGGRVALSWQSNATTITLRWIEKDGPPVAAARSKSFGTRLIEDALPRQFGGTGRLNFAPTGVEFELAVPVAMLAADVPS
jgi:two-component sensor histidine kinase